MKVVRKKELLCHFVPFEEEEESTRRPPEARDSVLSEYWPQQDENSSSQQVLEMTPVGTSPSLNLPVTPTGQPWPQARF